MNTSEKTTITTSTKSGIKVELIASIEGVYAIVYSPKGIFEGRAGADKIYKNEVPYAKVPAGTFCIRLEKDLTVVIPEEPYNEAYAIVTALRIAKVENACPGYTKLKELVDEYATITETNRRNFQRMMDTGCGHMPDPVSTEALEAEIKQWKIDHPRAACLRRAKLKQLRSNYHISGAGSRAEDLLMAGGSVEEAEEIMKNAIPEENMWD